MYLFNSIIFVDALIRFFNAVPDYVGEGVLHCVLMIISALVVGWVTSKFFAKRDELTRIEGVLLEKKIPIYEHISRQLTAMNALCALDPIYARPALEILSKHGVKMERQYQIHQMLLDPKSFREVFLEFEKYTMDHKLYFDESTALPILVFTNYLALINQLGAHFEHELEKLGVPIDDEVKMLEKQLYAAVGMLLKEDIANQILLLDKTIATSIQNLDFKHRKQPTYDYHTFMDSDGPVMKAISSTMLSQKRDMLNAILLDYVTLAKESVDCSCEG